MIKKNLFKSLITSIILVFAVVMLVACGNKNKATTTKPDDSNNTNNNNNNNNNGGGNNNNQFLSTARSIKVVQVDGSASVKDSKTTTNCFKGMNLYDGDTLTVSDDSTLVIKFDEDKYVYLGENTIINIKSEGKDKYKTNVYVTQGVVLAEVQKKLDEDEEFFLSSNNSVMAVRGTVFGLDVKTVGDNIVEAYAVYRGVTELYVFDKQDGNIISGKISDISNAKYEITIPKSSVISEDEINNAVGEWLDKPASTFDDATDANNKLAEVAITVSDPTREDFEKVMNTVESDVNYSGIEYTSKGFFGEYDGQAHKIEVTPTTAGATVSYSLDGINYQETNDFEFYSPGSYRVYYKIECAGEETKTDFEVIYITKPNVIIDTDYITYDSASNMAVINISSLDPEDFNRFNGVNANKVLGNQKFYISGSEVIANNITVNYNKLIDGYIELVDGKNTLNVEFEFDDFTLYVDVDFLFSDTREDTGYLIGVSNDYLHLLNGNIYWFDNGYSGFGTPSQAGYPISGSDLLTSFGLDVLDPTTMLINYPKDVIDTDIEDYDGTNSVDIEGSMFYKINFLVFPTATTKGYSDTIYVYVSNLNPDSYPTYTITKTTYTYDPSISQNGVLMNFVDSNKKVTYSLDGTDYSETLYLTAGTHKVYYHILTNEFTADLDVAGYEYVRVIAGQGEITFDNKMFITSPVHILSNDGNSLDWTYTDTESFTTTGTITSTNGGVITSLDDVYTVYTNMIKNAVFYDSISGETLDATVTVSEKQKSSASFDYRVEVAGYEPLIGTVRFSYSDISSITGSGSAPSSDEYTVTLPIDYEISLSEVAQAIPSRVRTTLENSIINYKTYYSADNGKTWSTTAPKLTTVGEHDVYVLYCFVDSGNDATTLVDGTSTGTRRTNLAASGNFIIDIAHITITE